MSKKIVLAGGTGFVGQYLDEKFKSSGYEVIIISRKQGHINWDEKEKIIEAIDGAELLINLAGKSVNCRYNETNKELIIKSRTETTQALCEAMNACKTPPSIWLNSSTATIYRHAEDRPMTEAEGEIGSGFSVHVATEWEKSFFQCELPGVRKVALRMAIVLGDKGGALGPYVNLVKWGLGGKQGSGQQMFSWLHIEDLYQMILYIIKNEDISGPVNCSSPNPVNNFELMLTLRRVLNRGFGLPAAKWMLKMGAAIMGTETELILKSRWVLPDKLQKHGYQFKHPELKAALQDILKN